MIEVIFKQRALRDIKDAINWYHHQSVGLGYDFLNCVEDATDKHKIVLSYILLYTKTSNVFY